MLEDKYISEIKKKVLDFMRHNNQSNVRLIINGNLTDKNVIVQMQTETKIITQGKPKKIIQSEYL